MAISPGRVSDGDEDGNTTREVKLVLFARVCLYFFAFASAGLLPADQRKFASRCWRRNVTVFMRTR